MYLRNKSFQRTSKSKHFVNFVESAFLPLKYLCNVANLFSFCWCFSNKSSRFVSFFRISPKKSGNWVPWLQIFSNYVPNLKYSESWGKEVTERFHENWEYWDTTGAKEPQASNFSAEVEQCCQLERKFKEEKIFINWSAFQSYLGQTYIFNYDSPLSLPPDIS